MRSGQVLATVAIAFILGSSAIDRAKAEFPQFLFDKHGDDRIVFDDQRMHVSLRSTAFREKLGWGARKVPPEGHREATARNCGGE